jgi:SAM-dependent methyltransferase
VYPDPRPAESSLSVIYPPNYYSRAAGVNASPDALDLTSFVGRTLHKMAVNRIAGNLAPYLRLGPGHTLLDIGCGSGRHLKSIQIETGCHAEGLDFEIRNELLRSFGPAAHAVAAIFFHDFGEQRYDVVYAAHLIEHVVDRSHFRKIDSILKPGGVCVLETVKIYRATCWPTGVAITFRVTGFAQSAICRGHGEASRTETTLLKVKFIPITFVIWAFTVPGDEGFKAPCRRPLSIRRPLHVKTTPVNLMRHGLAHVISRLEGLITGKTSCMITVIGKRNAANATP